MDSPVFRDPSAAPTPMLEAPGPLCHRMPKTQISELASLPCGSSGDPASHKPQDGLRRAGVGAVVIPSDRCSRGVMAQPDALMRGKRGLIMGIANNRSLAWGIARATRAHGAELALTYQGEALKKRVEPLAGEVGALVAGHCDVTDTASLDDVF